MLLFGSPSVLKARKEISAGQQHFLIEVFRHQDNAALFEELLVDTSDVAIPSRGRAANTSKQAFVAISQLSFSPKISSC